MSTRKKGRASRGKSAERSTKKPDAKPAVNADAEPTSPEPARAVPADWPTLDQLHGLGKAKEWGIALARDLADFKAGVISWTDVPQGCLLGGEPGTGKTTFAKALAATCNVPLVATSYGVWQRSREGHLGHVLGAMNDDFKRAIAKAPSILFIDEIDVIPSRENTSLRHRDWWDAIVGALLQALDGISGRDGVVVVGACNYPARVDRALVRAGRLDTTIMIDLPSIRELELIIRFHLGGDLKDADLQPVAIGASGFTGADCAKLVRDARRRARADRRVLDLADLVETLEEEANRHSPKNIRTAALHEAGHAAAAIMLNVSDDVTTTLIRRGRLVAETSLRVPAEAVTRKLIEDKIVVAMAGRAAEKVLLGYVTGGSGGAAQSDLAFATRLAVRAVLALGLSRNYLGYSNEEELEQVRQWRPDLAREVDQMLKNGYAKARRLIASNASGVRAVAAALIEKRALMHEEIARLLPAQRTRASRSSGVRRQ